MDFSTILGAVGSAASGGLFGLLGMGVKLWVDSKEEANKREHELAMREMDQAEMSLEHELKMKEVEAQAARDIKVAQESRLATEAQVQGEVAAAEITLREASYAQDKASYGITFIDAVRGLMRPTLTMYFAVLMGLIAWQLFKITGEVIPASEAQTLLKDIVNACIFLATTSVTWWFGSRPVKRG